MKNRSRNTVDTESADGDIVSILHILVDCFFYGHHLALQFPALVAEKLTSLVRIRVRKNLANSLC